MNSKVAIALLALPIGAFFSLAKPASAAVPSSPALSQGTIVAQRYDERYDATRREELRREEHRDDHRRVWVPRHWQSGFLGIGGHWVEGHWEDR